MSVIANFSFSFLTLLNQQEEIALTTVGPLSSSEPCHRGLAMASMPAEAVAPSSSPAFSPLARASIARQPLQSQSYNFI
jgi:hypothetical protein